MAAVAVAVDGGGSSTKYTVKFNTQGGTTISPVKVNSGSKVTRPSNPTRNGYAFLGWLLDGKSYDFKKAVTKDITLVASWKKEESSSEDDEKKKQEEEERKKQEQAELEAKINAENANINAALKYVDDSFDNIISLLSLTYNILAEDITIDGVVFRGAEIQAIKNKLN